MPDVCIDDFMLARDSTLVCLVDVLLLLCTAPIRKLSISTLGQLSQAFDRWMVFVSRNKIEEVTFSLHFPLRLNYFPVSSSLLSSVYVKKLELIGCTINVPLNFKGLKLLTSLILKCFSASDADLQRLIFSCPMLESLILQSSWHDIRDLNICAPNLQSLNISGKFRILTLQIRRLADLRFEPMGYVDIPAMQQRESNFTSLFGQNFNCITSVALNKSTLVYLGANCLQNNSLQFANLKHLALQLCSYCPFETAVALCFFQKAQQIERLEIQFRGYRERIPTSPDIRACSFEKCCFAISRYL